jgi:hypothetical protein
MPEDTHSHAEGTEHEHEAPTPDHSRDAATPPTTTAAVDVGPSAGGLSARIVLTLIGAGAMIFGAFLSWFNFPGGLPPGVEAPGTAGVEWNWSVLYKTDSPFDASFFASVGFIAIVLGLLALVGLALRTGWLTRLAGALALVVVILYAITLYRIPEADAGPGGFSIGQIGIGAWLVFAGGLVVLIAGFLGSRRVVSAQVPAAPSP